MTKAPSSLSAVEPWISPSRIVDSEPERSLGRVGALRAVAIKLDRSKAILHDPDADFVLRLWEGLLSGQWELIDWFDAEGRRFIIAKFERSTSGSTRKLTGREREVVLYASLGESSKTIGYELGISPSRVSSLLKRAMRKLGLRTRSHLVLIARTLDSHHRARASGPIEGDLYYV